MAQTYLITELPDGKFKKIPRFLVSSFNKVFAGCEQDLPVLAVAITGVLRSGKSFLLNLLVTYLEYWEKNGSDAGWEESGRPISGVAWASGEESVTHGIWMYKRPFILKPEVGPKFAVTLLDIQGLGDAMIGDAKIDNLIMYIGLQVSNVQIVNLERKVKHEDLTSVKMCTVYAAVNDGAAKVFDSLIFVARDYDLGDGVGERKDVFQKIVRHATSVDVRETSKGIQKAFKDVTCFYLPRPAEFVIGANERQRKLTVCESEIGKAFLIHSKALFRKLLSTPRPRDRTIRNAMLEFEELGERVPQHQLAMMDPEEAFLDIAAYSAFKEAANHLECKAKAEIQELESGWGRRGSNIAGILGMIGKEALMIYDDQLQYLETEGKAMDAYRKYKKLLKDQIAKTETAGGFSMLIHEATKLRLDQNHATTLINKLNESMKDMTLSVKRREEDAKTLSVEMAKEQVIAAKKKDSIKGLLSTYAGVSRFKKWLVGLLAPGLESQLESALEANN